MTDRLSYLSCLLEIALPLFHLYWPCKGTAVLLDALKKPVGHPGVPEGLMQVTW